MRDSITKDELRRLYLSQTNKELAEYLGVSRVTLIRMIDEAGIEKKGKGYAQKYLVV